MSHKRSEHEGNDHCVTYRWLEKEEFCKIDELCRTNGYPEPRILIGAVVVAECQGEIVAYQCVQLLPHTEPAWIHPEFRRGQIAQKWAGEIVEAKAREMGYGQVMVSTKPGDRPTAWVLGLRGYKKQPEIVWRKDLTDAPQTSAGDSEQSNSGSD